MELAFLATYLMPDGEGRGRHVIACLPLSREINRGRRMACDVMVGSDVVQHSETRAQQVDVKEITEVLSV